MSHLVDTDILVDHIRRTPGAADYIDSLGTWSYSIITAMELFAGAQSKKEIQRPEKFLRDFREIQLSTDIGAKGREIMRTYSKSDGIEPMDALIAATAMITGLTLATRNKKHFRAIKDLDLEVPRY
jgi:predicted nucleic acid-binding protein